MGANTLEITDQNFNSQVIGSAKPVLLDFWAPWCGPCRAIAPLLEELAAENQGTAVIGKLNIDDNPETAQQFGVSSIPTLLVFKGGQVVNKFVGVQPKARIQTALDAAKS
ncbi:MAG: thioredoxin [Planctomycetota bacterium]|jgi:thioredoxin 1